MNLPTQICLPLSDSPIESYLHHAFPLSILGESPQYTDWFYMNYIQLVYYEYKNSNGEGFLNFFFEPNNMYLYFGFPNQLIPIMDLQKLNKDLLISEPNQLLDFIKVRLANKEYVQLYLNEKYIPNRSAWQYSDYIHENLIYGYNNEHQIFNIYGYSNKMHIEKSTVSFNNILHSFFSSTNLLPWQKEIILYRKTEASPNITINNNNEYFIRCFTEYLNGESIPYKNRQFTDNGYEKIIFGINVYDCLVNLLYEIKAGNIGFNLLPFHVLYEHKKCMSNRILYLINKGYLISSKVFQDYKHLEDNMLLCRNLIMKYQITQQLHIIDKLIHHLKMIKTKEIDVLSDLVVTLKLSS